MTRMIAALFMTFGLAVSGLSPASAQNLSPTQEIDARTKAATAAALAEIAEAQGDGEAMLVAAKLVSELGRVAKRNTSGGEPTFYSVPDMVAAAREMGANSANADAVAASASADRDICYWNFQCGTFACDWVYICE